PRGEWTLKKVEVDWRSPALRCSQRSGQLPIGLRVSSRRKMIRIKLRLLFHVQCGDGVGNEVNIDDIHAIFRPQRQHRQAGKKHERAHHVELRSFATPAFSEYK